MISFFFLALGFSMGWWVRGTKAAVWVKKQFAAASE